MACDRRPNGLGVSSRSSRLLARPRGSGKETQNRPLLPLIRGLMPTLKRAQRRIAESLVSDPERFIIESISDLAKHAGVSTGSIVLFSKSLGFKGLPRLKISLARALAEPMLPSLRTTQDRNAAPCVLQSVFEKHIESLRETLRLNSPDTLNAAAKALADAPR